MKKTLMMIAATTVLFASCDKEGGKGKGTLEAEITMEVPELVYAQPTSLTATVVSSEPVRNVVFAGAKKTGDTYSIIGENQPGTVEGTALTVDFFADTKEMTDVAVTVSAGSKSKTAYFPVSKISGEILGDVWVSDPVEMQADAKVANHENDNATYTEPNTGAGSDTPSFFSMHGLKVNGEVKHILSLSEARPADGKNVSFAFVNVLENTAKQPDQIAYIGSQRGFAFCKISSLTAGTIGRQCDAYEVEGHSVKKAAESDFKMRLVRGSWKGADHWDEAEYKFVDALNLKIKNAKTNLEKMQAYWALRGIQERFDSATLVDGDPAEGEELTSFGGTSLLRRVVDYGPSAKKDPNETLRPGDYILIRSGRTEMIGEQEVTKYYYGIIQLQVFPDESKALNAEGRMENIEEINKLFKQPMYMSVKTQCEIYKD